MLSQVDASLRALARVQTGNGRLPVQWPSQTPAPACGSGRTCRLCHGLIERWQVEYEVKDRRDDTWLFFHLGCRLAWEELCMTRLSDAGASFLERHAP